MTAEKGEYKVFLYDGNNEFYEEKQLGREPDEKEIRDLVMFLRTGEVKKDGLRTFFDIILRKFA